MTYEQFEILRQWADRVANTANDTETNIRSIDLVHDIAGILAMTTTLYHDYEEV